MKYSGEDRKFTIYSEDEALIGIKTITLSAYLTDYPEVTSSDVTSTIEIKEAP